jgi:hypothetical protein
LRRAGFLRRGVFFCSETMMADQFEGFSDSVSGPATRAAAVVPHDVDALPEVPKALYVGTGGTVTLRGAGGGRDVEFKNVASGSYLLVRAQFVRATGTSAADIVALF